VSELESEPGFEGLGGEPELGEEFTPEATDLEALERSGSRNLGPGAVSSRFFDEQGRPRQTLELRSDAAVDAVNARQDEALVEQAEAAGPSALEAFDPGPASEQESWADQEAQSQAASYQAAQENQAALAARVAAAGRARDVTDAGMLGQVVAGVQEAVNGWLTSQYASGASSRQVAAAVQEWPFQEWLDGAIAERLQDAAYFEATKRTGLRRHAERSWAAQVVDHELGLRGPPQSIVEKYPSLLRMGERMAERSARLQESREQLAAIQAASRARSAWAPKAQPRSRRLHN
jgi:hypothetical protein